MLLTINSIAIQHKEKEAYNHSPHEKMLVSDSTTTQWAQ